MQHDAIFCKKKIIALKHFRVKGRIVDDDKVTTSIRLFASQRDELEKISRRTGVDVSHLIRVAIEAMLNHYDACGQRLVLPLQFTAPPLSGGHYGSSLVAEEKPGEPKNGNG